VSCVILEGKFNAPLTRHQPCGYIKLSRRYNAGLVLFVVPEARKYLLWKKLLEGCRTNISSKSPASNVMFWEELSRNHYIAITTWDTVLRRLERACTNELERVNDIKQLQGLTNAMDIDVFRPLRETDIKQDIARRFNSYLDLPRDILAEAERQELCKRKKITKKALGFGFPREGR
jgi:hypothetical protein